MISIGDLAGVLFEFVETLRNIINAEEHKNIFHYLLKRNLRIFASIINCLAVEYPFLVFSAVGSMACSRMMLIGTSEVQAPNTSTGASR